MTKCLHFPFMPDFRVHPPPPLSPSPQASICSVCGAVKRKCCFSKDAAHDLIRCSVHSDFPSRILPSRGLLSSLFMASSSFFFFLGLKRVLNGMSNFSIYSGATWRRFLLPDLDFRSRRVRNAPDSLVGSTTEIRRAPPSSRAFLGISFDVFCRGSQFYGSPFPMFF